MGDRRRRSAGFVNVANEELKVGITKLQEQLEGTCTNRYTLKQLAQQARNETCQKIFEILWHEEEEE